MWRGIGLADNNFGDTVGDGVAGPIGLLIIVLLVIATILLMRNMNMRLKRLPAEFPDTRPGRTPASTATDPAPDDEPATSTTDADPPAGPVG
jgi:hypothetical protein